MTRPVRERPTRIRPPRVTTLPRLMAIAVGANPSGTAIVHADATTTLAKLSYAELDEQSTRLARLLVARGVGPEDLVVIGIPRSVESVVAVWAVAKTGAGFVPVDPNYPADRVAHMVSDSGALFGLTVDAVRIDLPDRVEWLVIDNDDIARSLENHPSEAITPDERVRPLRAEHPAYVIYTSGSTGKPKGVVVTQAGLSGFCDEQRDRYRLTPEARTLHFASPSFDASVLELLLALGGAATMVVASPDIFGGEELAALLRSEGVTHAFITPAALASVDPAGLDNLRVVVAGGEACPPDLVRRWVLPIANEQTREFFNGYGPTETTIMTNISAPMVPGEPVTIGGPIRGITEYVLDERLAPVPDGVVGELYITGAQLARGYHERPSLTAARFVANPFDPNGSRLYRTGDLARWTARGEIEYAGRNDFQVKIRGFRIELGEVDAVLAAHDSVDFAVTVGHELATGARILVSYVHAAAGASVDVAELATFVERSLPAHMVPTSIMVLDEIPLTPVGKLDRRALPEPVLETQQYRAPETETQRIIADVVADALGIERIGIDDDFFALGGDSITAIQVASRARSAGVVFTPREMFESRTVAALATLARSEDPAALGEHDETAGPLVELAPADADRLAQAYPNLVDVWPLTSLQSGMLFHALLAESSIDAYIVQFMVDLGGDVDADRLRVAAEAVVDRHVNLRVAFAEDGDGNPVQVVLDGVAVPWRFVDLSDPDPAAAAAAVERFMAVDMATHFDMGAAPLVRFVLIRSAADAHHLLVTSHHILIDGWSMPLLTQDLLTHYALGAHADQLSPARTYRSYLAWLAAQDHTAAREAWRAALAGFTEPTPLAPADPVREISAGVGVVEFELTETETAALSRLAAGAGVTVNTVVQAAWGLLIGRSIDRDDVVFGATVSGRPPQLAGVEAMVGLFLNAIPVRVRLNAADTLAGLLRQLQDEQAALLDYHHLGLSEIQEIAGVDGLFDSLVVFESAPVDTEALSEAHDALGGMTITGATAVNGTHYPLTVMLVPDVRLQVMVKYLRDLFEESAVQALAQRFSAILARFVAEPEARLAEVDVLTAAERAVLDRANVTEVPELLDDSTLLTLFDAQVARTPDALAVIFGETTLSYAELDTRARELATELAGRGVGPESLVAVAMRRSIDLVVAIYAVLRAGGAYVPIDPDHPAERNEYVLSSANPVCVLTTTRDRFETAADVPLVAVDELRDSTTVRVEGPLVRPDNPAYVIYTSGSTGRPKGVVITHRQMANQFRWAQRTYPHDTGDAVLHKTPITFDISTWELFWPLHTGAAVVIAEPDGHRDPAYLARMIDEYSVTTVHFVPSMLDTFLDEAGSAAAEHPSLRRVFAAGEALSAEVAAKFAAVLPGTRLLNWYGPAEATVVTAHPAESVAGVAVPIGMPVANTQVHVLDRQLRPVPLGAAGELYIDGVQLARGYLGAPALTAERFVAAPNGQRLYRTGDMVRWITQLSPNGAPPDCGALEYLGRSDFQVKLRGQRIELGEIETVLLGHADVQRAAVALVRGGTGDRLVAYVVAVPGADIDKDALLAHAREALPSYMVPAAVVTLAEMPLNASGKLDRKALPEPEFEARPYREPATAAERAVAEVFAEVLGVERVGADDDFFDLGGNSLIATRVVARLGATLAARIPVRSVFETPTVAGLAAAVGAVAGTRQRVPLVAGLRPERIPLSLAQQRMWFLNQFDMSSAVNNLPVAVRLTGALDVAALRRAVADVVDRHETLRTVYPVDRDSVAHQVILPAAQAVPDLTPESIAADAVPARIAEIVSAGFDVTTEVPLRGALLRVAADDYVLVVVVHHISADGWSMGPLTRDVMLAYAARSAGAAPQWEPLPVQYADFSIWQRAVLGSEDDPDSLISAQADYWRGALAGVPDELNLPADRPRPAVQSFAGGQVGFAVDERLRRGLQDIAREQNASLFMVMHTALAVFLARLTGTGDIAVGTPVAGRGEAELDDVIGMFVNTLVLRTPVRGELRFAELLAQVRDADLQAFAHADIPFERLVELLNPQRSTARHPLFQVALMFQNLLDSSFELPGLRVGAVDLEIDTAKFDLSLAIRETATGVYAEFSFARDLFDEATVRGFADRFVRLLDWIVSSPDVAVGDLDLLDATERDLTLRRWNDTVRDIGPQRTLVELFAVQAQAAPYAVAIVDRSGPERKVLNYTGFAARVRRLARRLIESGVGPETLVALGMRRSLDFLVAAYAVLEAGGGYVPLDPDQPADRIRYVLDTADPVCILTTTRDADSIDIAIDHPAVAIGQPGSATGPADSATYHPGEGQDPGASTEPSASAEGEPGFRLSPERRGAVRIDELDLSAYSDAPVTDAERIAPLRAENPAYVIFTSGSTGRPKGVAVPHAAAVNQIRWITGEYGIGASDVVLFKTPATFDVSVWELFGPLTTGGQVVIAAPDGHRDPRYLADIIAAEQVTMTSFVPSMLTVFASSVDAGSLTSLRALLLAGEALTANEVGAIRRISTAALYNLYGPTEFTVHSTHTPVADDVTGAVPIGRPVWNAQAYVLDARLHPLPAGVAGELYLAGDQLARGYFGRPDLTADRFVADPFGAAGARMYRTGDLVTQDATGAISYLGRTDFQVKLRGQRIELGEIESALTAHDSVAQAVVVVRSDPHTGDRLVGYVVPAAGATFDQAALRTHLADRLPAYMVPAAFVALDTMPLNPNGKLDRKALPDPEFRAAEFRAPVNAVERAVADAFAGVLRIGADATRAVGLDDDFFALGGNSLLATQVVARLGEALDTRVPVRIIFEASSVADLAAAVERIAGGGSRRALVAAPRPERIPLSLAQQRMWFLNRFDTASAAYNIPIAVRLSGALDVDALRLAVADLVERHEILRTTYPQTSAGPKQLILSPEESTTQLEVYTVAPGELESAVRTLLTTGFDVTAEVPVRVALYEIGAAGSESVIPALVPGVPANAGTQAHRQQVHDHQSAHSSHGVRRDDAGSSEYVLAMVVHHICADGSSVAPLTRDLMIAYAARSAGEAPGWAPLAVQYADYSIWQREALGSEEDPDSPATKQIDYWKAALADLPEQLDLPSDRPRPPVRTFAGGHVDLSVDADTHQALADLARTEGATLFMVVHTALAVVLSRLSGADDIAIGTPVAGRGEAALDDLIGMFVNTLVFRTRVDAGEAFTDLLARQRQTDIQAFAHADIPFERLVEVLNPARSAARHPLFQVGLSFQNMTQAGLALPGLTISGLDIDTQLSQFDLNLTMADTYDEHGAPTGIAGRLVYATDLFDEATAAGFAERFLRLLAAIATAADTPVGDIDLMTGPELDRILVGCNDTRHPIAPGLLLDGYGRTVAAQPDAVAVACEGAELTYREFDERVNRLARLLISQGVGA
ncbi:amino acid adenylation domain-containing protein, partial [Nocardia sp. NPDC049707]|uniref:non-ribosomal peptide synthetase n=1 Tax=Nocardia sp. NPDC049707 TaxID=3154735 RepID=UPI0034328CA4